MTTAVASATGPMNKTAESGDDSPTHVWRLDAPETSVWANRPHLQGYVAHQCRSIPAKECSDQCQEYDKFRARVEATVGPIYLAVKRGMDITVSLAALVLLSPLFLVLGILVKLSDFGPVFYAHRRVGLHGRVFTCYKFRSMRVDADKLRERLLTQNRHDDSRTFKMANDPRITSIGRWIRWSSLDELPQLLNVLFGDMSLVGPRPPIPAEVERYTIRDLRRFEVKPGITCIWQVSGRSRIPFARQIEMDCQYMTTRSLWLDCKLLVATVPAVLSADGAC